LKSSFHIVTNKHSQTPHGFLKGEGGEEAQRGQENGEEGEDREGGRIEREERTGREEIIVTAEWNIC